MKGQGHANTHLLETHLRKLLIKVSQKGRVEGYPRLFTLFPRPVPPSPPAYSISPSHPHTLPSHHLVGSDVVALAPVASFTLSLLRIPTLRFVRDVDPRREK